MLPLRKRVTFPGALGHTLVGRLDLPADSPRAFALFAHCFTCGKDLKAIGWIARALLERRIALLRFDFTGLGESGGEFADTNFASNIADLIAAAHYLRRTHRAPRLLIGHSLGGTAVLAGAAEIPDAAAIATIAAPSRTAPVSDFIRRQAPGLRAADMATVDVMGQTVQVRGRMLDDLARHDVTAAVARLGRPLLIMHSPADAVVEIGEAERIFAAARHPKSFVALDGADHLLLERETDARYVADVLGAWAERYLEEPAPRG